MTAAFADRNAALMVNGAGLQTRTDMALGLPAASITIVPKFGVLSIIVQRETARLVDVVAERKLFE